MSGRCLASKIVILLLIFLSMPAMAAGHQVPIGAYGLWDGQVQGYQSSVKGDNTVVLSGADDYIFMMDYSFVLDRLNCEWAILYEKQVPEAYHHKNIILIGGPNSGVAWDLILDLFGEGIYNTMAEGQFSVLEMQSPFDTGMKMFVCTGTDDISLKRAAESCVISLMGDGLHGRWIGLPFSPLPSGEVRTMIRDIMFMPTEDVIASVQMISDGANAPSRISLEEAREDVEYFFYVLENGYCGYGFFMEEGRFELAKAEAMAMLEQREEWTPDELSSLLHDSVGFIRDCHMKVGEHTFCERLQFLYVDDVELWFEDGAYRFMQGGTAWELVSVMDAPPDDFVFPSIDADGSPVYLLGMLAPSHEGGIEAQATNGQETITLSLDLDSSSLIRKGIFSEDTIGGIPVVRIRSFGDYYYDELQDFLDTAQKYKGEPFLILDIRGNGGGNTQWPKNWVLGFTGALPSSRMARTELVSKTSIAGRYNYFNQSVEILSGPQKEYYESQLDNYESMLDSFDSGILTPYWDSLYIPQVEMIPNGTTVIVIMDGGVASAGEGFIDYLSQVENTVFIGENTMGALTFGQISYHRLPKSKVDLVIPISLNIFVDNVFREEAGLMPDIWVPSQDALNYAVAAVRNGLITTSVEVPQGYFDQEFEPEDYSKRDNELVFVVVVLASSFTITNLLYFLVIKKRRKRD